MKKIITTLTAVTFALGLAAVAQAQVAKTRKNLWCRAPRRSSPR